MASKKRTVISSICHAVTYVPYTFYDRIRTLGLTRMFSTIQQSYTDSETVLIDDSAEAEDLHYHRDSGMLFAASQRVMGSRAKWFPPAEAWDAGAAGEGQGGIIVIDPKTMKSTRLILDGFSGAFCTHGIDVISDPASPRSAVYIHIINHLPNPEHFGSNSVDSRATKRNKKAPKAASQVEIFRHELHSDRATHLRSVVHPLIFTPNNVLSTGPFSFHITNDHFYREGLMRVIEDLGSKRWQGWSNVVHVRAAPQRAGDGKPSPEEGVEATVSLSGLHNNNGLGRTSVPGEVLVTDASGGICYFGKETASSGIELIDEVKVTTTIDNPSWFEDPFAASTGRDASGLILGGLTQAAPFFFTGLESKASATVWYVRRKEGDDGWEQPVALFQDNGSLVKIVTTAVLVVIDPKDNEGKKPGWLFVTSALAKAIAAVKADL